MGLVCGEKSLSTSAVSQWKWRPLAVPVRQGLVVSSVAVSAREEPPRKPRVPLGLCSTHGITCNECGMAACVANASTLTVKEH